MATSSLIGRRVFLAAAKRSTYQQALQSSALRAASTTSHYSHGDSSSSSSSASRFGLLGAAGAFVGMTGFGASAPAGELYKHFGITSEAVVKAVKDRI